MILRTVASCCVLALLAGLSATGYAQLPFKTKWMTAGALHDWYASTGCEIEEGRVTNQQDGLRWPAFYKYTDSQAAKGFWIGASNFDANGVKVVHVGPRVSGQGEFFATKFEMVAKYPAPTVMVDGGQQLLDESAGIDRVDATMAPDRMIINELNTQLGITMKRVIKQFSQQYHDNYIVYEYTFTNTGNTNDDAVIELPGKTLTGVYFFWQNRYAVNRDVSLVIGNNPVQWGYNTMNDARGDGVKPDPVGEQFRAQFSWHGRYAPFTTYDNIGGPIWQGYWDKSDTIGRLGAPQFVGNVTLHADVSPTDSSDDITQPKTTGYVGSDDALTRNNSSTDLTKMGQEYALMSGGHMSPRHADKVEPSGNFKDPTGDPSLGTSGGWSSFTGYGPYTLAPGQSVKIVIAEGMAGLSREIATSVGRRFKAGSINRLAKNDSVFTGRDSLFQTFRRAIANYKSGYAIPPAPWPPRTVGINGGGDKIAISWEAPAGGPAISGYRIYRATGAADTVYKLLYTAGATERVYNDTGAVRGIPQYYFVVSVGQNRPTDDPATLTPAGPLVSNRSHTGATSMGKTDLKRQAGASMEEIRIVPNPFSINANDRVYRISGFPDMIKFYNIPGYCKIRVYTELGELIKEITHDNGSGDDEWNSVTSTNQVIVSGVYIVVFENTRTGERTIRKLAVIR
jgi:hypothetical protein